MNTRELLGPTPIFYIDVLTLRFLESIGLSLLHNTSTGSQKNCENTSAEIISVVLPESKTIPFFKSSV